MSRALSMIVLALVLTLPPFTTHALCVNIGKPVPDVTLPSLQGDPVSLSRYQGKIVLLAFWASWCPRCEEELTFLQGVYKTSPDITVVAINQESQNISRAHVERIKETLADWKIDFPVLLDKNLDAWNTFCINALPTSIILDKKGIVRWAEANYYWASQDTIAAVIQAIRLGKEP